jgi:sporulation protein YlmC with PRC-barrel domain
MLEPSKRLIGRRVEARDGEMGKVKDVYFDQRTWNVRYLVVDTGRWLPGRQVLISPTSVGALTDDQHLSVLLTKAQVEDSPPITWDKPVSREMEEQLALHYSWPAYWVPPIPGAPILDPMLGGRPAPQHVVAVETETERTLRSIEEVSGYRIAAIDGDLGHVDQFLIDTDSWMVTGLVIDTKNWLPGKKVVLSPSRIRKIDWASSHVEIDLDRERVKAAEEYRED